MHFDAVAKFQSSLGRRMQHAVLAAHQDRPAKPLIDEGERGPNHLLFLALGEDDALRAAPHPLENRLHDGGDRIAPSR